MLYVSVVQSTPSLHITGLMEIPPITQFLAAFKFQPIWVVVPVVEASFQLPPARMVSTFWFNFHNSS